MRLYFQFHVVLDWTFLDLSQKRCSNVPQMSSCLLDVSMLVVYYVLGVYYIVLYSSVCSLIINYLEDIQWKYGGVSYILVFSFHRSLSAAVNTQPTDRDGERKLGMLC